MVAAGSITVAVRVRPPTSAEAARLPPPCYEPVMRGDAALWTPGRVANTATLRDIVEVVDDRILTFDPNEQDRARAFVERGFLPPGTKRYKDKRFMFDRVFGHDARQQEVYEGTTQPLLKGLLEGFNATVFAYGATGCGKTHTISGTEANPGIVYLTMADMFQMIEDRKDEWHVEVMVTFLEIYNEEIRDLLAEPGSAQPRGGLSIREDKTVKVVGLVELQPRTADDVKRIVLQGNARRTQSPTHANETSSRSHAVLQVHVTQSPRTATLTEQRTMATLSIIDLAGSERAAATTNMGQRMIEGANINKSLLALGNCINALCESGGATRHVPYRNSKLTRLLKFSLGGNCKTVMIVCVAPTSNHFDDTHNTLVYAERATKIKTKVVTRNVVNVDRHVGRYVEAINRLNIEVAELKQKLSERKTGECDIIRRKKAEAAAEVERVKGDMKAKVTQTKASILEGAICSAKLSVAKIKLLAIQTRFSKLPQHEPSKYEEAERALLQALAHPENEIVMPTSAVSVRMQHASNASALFDATMRAMSEKKSEKLDELSLDILKLDALCNKAEMERMKAEAEREVMQDAVGDLSDIAVNLLAMLGRCTVMAGEAAHILDKSTENDGGSEMTAGKIVRLLSDMKEKNDATFESIVGQTTTHPEDASLLSLDAFRNYGVTFGRRFSTDPAVKHQVPKTATSRRQSSFGLGLSSSSVASPARRTYRSPRKSLRSSLVSQPHRRASDREKKGTKSAKNVQWRDEAGQGDLDDGGAHPVAVPLPSVNVVPASPAADISPSNASTQLPRSQTLLSRSYPSVSFGGLESEWEDDNEKTDDSTNLSLSLNRLHTSTSSRPVGKWHRPSRLDPNFLKPKSRISGLGSLVEDDENSSPERPLQPLTDLNLNSMSSEDSGNRLHVPKIREPDHSISPGRGTSIPNVSSSSRKEMNGRRRSNIGPLRSEKARRRSSLIAHISPPTGGEAKLGARRVLLTSPGWRGKRVSLTRSLQQKPKLASTSFANLSVVSSLDPNASLDLVMARGSKPTWR